MATFKRRTLVLSSGREIKLADDSLSIGSTLEIGTGFNNNILALNADCKWDDSLKPVANYFNLTQEEVSEILDYIIGSCIQLKDNIRQHGINSPEIFRKD